MSAHISKDTLALVGSERVGHYFKDEPEYMARPEVPRVDVFGHLWNLAKWMLEMPRRRAIIDELSTMSEHELSDIGLSRADLNRVFDPNFAAERRDARATLDYLRPAAM